MLIRKSITHIVEGLHRGLYKKLPIRYQWKSHESFFSDVYRLNTWGKQGSRSGTGSDLIQTAVIRQQLPLLLKELNVKSIMDGPCGDLQWMEKTDLGISTYVGADVVPDLISENNLRYGSTNRRFMALDITQDDLPQVDLILCRDCLVHLPFKDIHAAIANFKESRSTYLLTTTYPGLLQKNRNIVRGNWQPLDLQLPPFTFPEPLRLINEECTEAGDFPEKSLGLWKLEEL